MPEFIPVRDLEDPALSVYTHLNENQLRHYNEPRPEGLFIAESPAVIERALDAGYEPVSLLLEEKYVETQAEGILGKLQAREGEVKIPVYVSTIDVLSRLTGYHLNRGILGAFQRKKLPSVREVCENARRIAVLVNVENPTNVGAVFRSAAALGMDAVLVTPASADPLQRRAIRVSVGTVFQIPWTYIGQEMTVAHARALGMLREENGGNRTGKSADNDTGRNVSGIATNSTESRMGNSTVSRERSRTRKGTESGAENSSGNRVSNNAGNAGQAPSLTAAQISDENRLPAWPDRGMKELQGLGFRTAAMALRHDTISLEDPRLHQIDKLAILLGNEGEGLPEETLALCDCTIRIPMAHGVDSLNVAAASAVAFWELGKR